MIFVLCVLLTLYVLYELLAHGTIWKTLVLVAAWFGIYFALSHNILSSNHIMMTIVGYTFSWAEVTATFIVFLCMAVTMRHKR